MCDPAAQPTMTRICAGAVAAFLLCALAIPASASFIEINRVGDIGSPTPGLEAAVKAPKSSTALVVGSNGLIRLVSSDNPTLETEQRSLSSPRNEQLLSIGWHPTAQSAMIGGENATLLRYSSENGTVEAVDGAFGALLSNSISAISWDPSGGFALIGTREGTLAAYAEGSIQVLNRNLSHIVAIDCHTVRSICLAATQNDGIIAVGRELEMHFLSTTKTTIWTTIGCPTDGGVCVAAGNDAAYSAIKIDSLDLANTVVGAVERVVSDQAPVLQFLQSPEGDLLGITSSGEILEYRTSASEPGPSVRVYSHLERVDVISVPELAGDRFIGGWLQEESSGYVISSDGDISRIGKEGEVESSTPMNFVLFAVVIIAVPGTILGLIFMNSPWLQRAYIRLRRRIRGKKPSNSEPEGPRRRKRS